MKQDVFLPDDYRPAEDEPFMNERQVEYFRRKLLHWKHELLAGSKDTIEGLQDGTRNIPDVADRASEETDRALELRTRDRQRKLVTKIDAALRRIEDGEYGYCEVTGEPISLKRLDRNHEPGSAGTPRAARKGPSGRLTQNRLTVRKRRGCRPGVFICSKSSWLWSREISPCWAPG